MKRSDATKARFPECPFVVPPGVDVPVELDLGLLILFLLKPLFLQFAVVSSDSEVATVVASSSSVSSSLASLK